VFNTLVVFAPAMSNQLIQQHRRRPYVSAVLIATITVACSTNPGSTNPGQPDGPGLFLVAEKPGYELYNDSYVIPLTDPDLIAQARELISTHNRIVVARIVAGKDGVNRDYKDVLHPEWSWHVTEVLAFAEAAIELCDGTPTIVERDVQGWIANTGGLVCFWAYSVVAELKP